MKLNEFVCGVFVWEPEDVCTVCTCAFKISVIHLTPIYFIFPNNFWNL